MVTQDDLYNIQQTVVTLLEKEYDGYGYYGDVQNPRFLLDFYPDETEDVTTSEIASFIETLSLNSSGTPVSLLVKQVPDTSKKGFFIIKIIEPDR
jgi:hypothetical protein